MPQTWTERPRDPGKRHEPRSMKMTNARYFGWLVRKTCDDRPEHVALMKILHKKVFYSLIENDDNRAADGIALREDYAREKMGNEPVSMEDPCSVLEMLIALAIRMEFMLSDYKHSDRTDKWFWEMITNLGLGHYPDTEIPTDEIIENFIMRKYNTNGKGGLFPLKRNHDDQRNVEIWYQLAAYIDENRMI